MTPEQAREILALYRPWAAEADDPALNEALEMAQRDPELRAWFEQHCAVQLAFRSKLKAMPVPAGLKEQILSERPQPQPYIVPLWRRPAVLTAVTVVVLLMATAGLWWPSTSSDPATFDNFRRRMVGTALRTYSMDLETNDVRQIRSFLAQYQTHADFVAPQPLAEQPLVGCGVLKWQGHRVAMICFRSGRPLAPGEKSDLFLFVIDQASLPSATLGPAPDVTPVSRLATASWSAGNKVYVLAGTEDEAALRRYLPGNGG